jgi:delta14-sterol reductase
MAATRSKTKAQVVEKPTVHYEFGGPVGALGIIVSLPAVCYGLVFFCNADVCIRLGGTSTRWQQQRIRSDRSTI